MTKKKAKAGVARTVGGFQPWMANRRGESNEERVARLEHTCYRCGWECRDSTVLDLHQDVCGTDDAQPTG